jgi:hypothetical protein
MGRPSLHKETLSMLSRRRYIHGPSRHPGGSYLYPVFLTHARVPHDVALTVIGDPSARSGAIEVHMVYPDGERAISQEDYMTLRHRGARPQAHADQYEASVATDG